MTQKEMIDQYLRNGWSLVPIPPGRKGPVLPGWNTRGAALTSADLLSSVDWGVGLGHAYSGTMAFDIDDWDLTRGYGIDVDALYAAPDAVIIESGKPGHGKLLYQMPLRSVLPSKKIVIEKKTAFEFRCGTVDGLTVQDVLPPSIHPEMGQPYRWAGQGHWSRLPVIPNQLLNIWMGILSKETTTVNVDGVDASWDDIRSALTAIPPDCSRDEWISVGMALHWTGVKMFQVDQAFTVWNEWSRNGYKYPGEREMLHQWNSFKTNKGVTITTGTVFHIARQYGWVRPVPDASTLFGSVKAASPSALVRNLRPLPPDLDLSLFPGVLSQRAQEVSDTVGCDPLVPLFAGLAAVCGVVDARIRLELMPGFKVPPVLWLMTMGDPADKKTPGSRPMFEAIKVIEAEDRPRFKKELLDWEAKEAAYSSAKKAHLEAAAKPEFLLAGQVSDDLPALPPQPEQPVPLKITVSDITSQMLVRQAAGRPRGLFCKLDEMNSWIRKMVDRSSGEDRSAWVVSYESDRYEMDRVGAGSIHADNLAVSIYGNIQPRVFRENALALSADGLLQRFIPAVLRHDKTRLGQPIPEYLTTESKWEGMLRTVFAIPPMTFKLSPEAFQVFRDFQAWYERAKHNERLLQSDDTFMTAFGKLEGLVGRIALLFHVIETPFSPYVSEALMKRVVRFVRSYVIPAYRYVYGDVASNPFEMWVMEYLIQHCDEPGVTLTEIKRSARRPLEGFTNNEANQKILLAMMTFEEAHWVAKVSDDPVSEYRGAVEWLINPALRDVFKDYRQMIVQAKQDLRNEIWEASGKHSPIPARVHGADEVGI